MGITRWDADLEADLPGTPRNHRVNPAQSPALPGQVPGSRRPLVLKGPAWMIERCTASAREHGDPSSPSALMRPMPALAPWMP